ncbi:MAG TPA: phosphoglucosamine mutase [Egibacteraceae bacterium]|nr:phosphoglucosamine mutase [Egibacteraceae bacterium]
MGRLFGTDGIRGVANTELTPELAVGLGRALVRTLREEGVGRPRVVIGRDPRVSGEMLEGALLAGVCSAGGDVVPVGVLPTPGVAFLTVHLGASSGAMISASHNPVDDNGIKFFGADGFKLTDGKEERIEELLQLSDEARPTGAALGRVTPEPQAVDAYVEHLVATGGDLTGLRVVVDCAEGAAFAVAPEVLRRLGCDVTATHAAPTGTNINDGCGSTHPETVARAVREHGADVGLAHDGDADRLIAVDHTGAVVDGDAILALLAERMHAAGRLDTVVTTVMTNLGFHQAMDRLGIKVLSTKVGDRYVLEAMRAHGHPLGGEQSGHVILTDHATTGDGILTAVQLLTAVAETGRPLADLAGVMRRLPQVLLNVRNVDRERLADAARLWEAVRQEEAALDGSGRVLVRASGTEQLVRVMVEADSQDRAEAVAERLAAVAADELRIVPSGA